MPPTGTRGANTAQFKPIAGVSPHEALFASSLRQAAARDESKLVRPAWMLA